MNKNRNEKSETFETRDLRDPGCHNSNLFKTVAANLRKRKAARERAQREKEIREMESSFSDIIYP